MKKILLYLSLIISCSASAQLPPVSGFVNRNTKEQVISTMAQQQLSPPADTTYTKLGFAIRGGVVWYGNGTFWTALTPNQLQDGVVNGCAVVYKSGLTYTVTTPCIYNIAGSPYSLSAAVDVTLPDGTADPGEFRTDAIVVNTSSTATSVTGDNSVAGVGEFAVPDPATQMGVGYVRIDEDNTTPTGVSQTIVRDEGSGGEWTISKTLTSTDNYATNPFHLTISQRITGANSNQYMQWIAPAVQSKATFNTLLLYIRNNSAFANVRNLTVTLRNGNATQVGNAINLTTYGYIKNLTGSYQTIAIPMSAFAGADAFDRIRITNTQVGGTVDVQIDYVQLQSGITTGPPAAVKQVFFNSVADLRAYSGTPDIAGITLGYTTSTDGGGAEYRWDGTSVAADNGGSVIKLAAYATGRMLMNIKNHSVNVKQFGATGNGISDDRPAFIAAYTALPRVLIAFTQYTRGSIIIPQPDSAYYISDSLLYDDQISLYGATQAEFPFATIKINVASGKTGINFKMGNPSGGSRGSYAENIGVFALGTSEDTTKNGIVVNGLIHLKNVHAENFGGNGITITTVSNGNANSSQLDNCGGQQNGLDGLRLDGGESSAILVINPNFQFNGRFNIHDNGFLGATIVAGHTSGAGMRSGHTSDAIASRGGRYYVCKRYHINKEPTVASGWADYWEDVGTSVELTASVAAWSSGTTYQEAANYGTTGQAQAASSLGLYREGGTGGDISRGSSISIGGAGAAQFNREGALITNRENYIDATGGAGFQARDNVNSNIYTRLDVEQGLMIGAKTASADIVLGIKANVADSIIEFTGSNNGVEKFFFQGRDLTGLKYGLATHTITSGTPNVGKYGLGFLNIRGSATYPGTDSIRRFYMGTGIPLSEGLYFGPGDFVLNMKDMASSGIIGWQANTLTPGGDPDDWDPISGGTYPYVFTTPTEGQIVAFDASLNLVNVDLGDIGDVTTSQLADTAAAIRADLAAGGSSLFPLTGTGTATGTVTGNLATNELFITSTTYTSGLFYIDPVNGRLGIGDIDANVNNNYLDINDNGNYIKVNLSSTGIFATTNLSDTANYTPESYVTKAYVDDHIANAGGGGGGGITGTMVANRIPYGVSGSVLTTSSALAFDGTNLLTIGGGQIRDNGSNMRFIASGGWEFFNATNNGAIFYDGAGADGIAISGFGRTINSASNTADLKIQNANAAGKLGVGGTPDASAKFHVVSTTLAAIPYPVMTTSQRNAISSPIAGDGVYCSDCTASDASTGVVTIYNGSTWKNCW